MDNNRIDKVNEKYTAWVEKNRKLFLDLVGNGFMIDTGHKYLDWLVYTLTKGKVDLPLESILRLLRQFDETASQLDRKNIYSYTDIYDVETSVVRQLQKNERAEAAEVVQKKKEKKAGQVDEEKVYHTYTEFVEQLQRAIVETYPRSFKVREFEVQGDYDSDTEGNIRLFYQIPYFNTVLHVDIHLFDSDSPLTIQTDDLSAKREEKNKPHRLPFSATAFKNRSLCFNLLKTTEDGANLCLKLIEFSVALFVDGAPFRQLFSAANVFVNAAPVALNQHIEPFLQYVRDKQESGAMATKADYVLKYLNRPTTNVRSFQRQTIQNLLSAGVVNIHRMESGYTYRLGDNYQAFIEGRLKPV